MKMPDPCYLIVAMTHGSNTTYRMVRGQLSHAREKGFHVAFLCSPSEMASRIAESEGVELLEVSMERNMAPFKDLAALWRLCLIFSKRRPTLVNAGIPKAGLLVTLAAWLCGVPCRIYTLRGLRFETTTGLRRVILKLAERLTCMLSNRVICISPSLRRRAVELGIISPRKAIVLKGGSSNGMDTDHFAPTFEITGRSESLKSQLGIPHDALVVGFVGRLVRDKGLLEFTEAWQILRQEFSALHLLVIGPFESGDPVPESVRQVLCSDPRIHLTGEVNLEEMPVLYKVMHILALPSYREGFGNVLIEAAAMELPVVATKIPGCVDAVQDGVTGTLVPTRDAESLACAIRRYLNDPDLRLQHGRAGRERVLREFRQEAVWEALYQEYISLLREKKLFFYENI